MYVSVKCNTSQLLLQKPVHKKSRSVAEVPVLKFMTESFPTEQDWEELATGFVCLVCTIFVKSVLTTLSILCSYIFLFLMEPESKTSQVS